MELVIALIISGVVLCFGAFVFAALNMGRQANKTFSGDFNSEARGFGGMFGRHIGAMIAMAGGGVLVVLGFIFGSIELLQHFGL